MFRTDRPKQDAQSYLKWYDSLPMEPDHTCSCCDEGFFAGMKQGMKMGEEYFCNPCIDKESHIGFYKKACGLSAKEIEKVIAKEKQL